MDIPLDQLEMQEIDPLRGKHFLVRKRDGRLEEFNEARIFLAIESAFKARHSIEQDRPLPESAQSDVKNCADKVVEQVLSRAVRGEELEVEQIQDAVENQLMLGAHLDVVRCYILYRDARKRARAEREGRDGLGKDAKPSRALTAAEIVSARLKVIYIHALPKTRGGETTESAGRRHFDCYLNEGDYLRCLTPALLNFETDQLAAELRWERDSLLSPAGLELLYDRFLARDGKRRFETPQYFWMRIAMGLALGEPPHAEARALRFYEVLSTLRFIPSESILTHTGTTSAALIDAPHSANAGDAHPVEIWHRDVLELLDGPSGDLNLGLWIPDLFMKRLQQQSHWTLLDPAEAAELNRCRGSHFESRYLDFEQKAERGQIGFARQRKASELWQGVMGSAVKTGLPGIVFKDAIHNSATTGNEDTCAAVALERPSGAVNLAVHIREDDLGLDVSLLRETITAAVRMLDNALDASAFASNSVCAATLRYRPIGLGIVGFHEALTRLKITPGTTAAADFADWSAELVSHCAILASAQLAAERGSFPGFAESRWSNGILPIDAVKTLSKERGLSESSSASNSQDWAPVRALIEARSLRNGIIMTTDPLETPAKIAGVTPGPAGEEGDPSVSIECAARRQKWSDVDETLALPMRTDPTAAGTIHMQAWEKGISRIHPLVPGRQSQHRATAPSPEPVLATP